MGWGDAFKRAPGRKPLSPFGKFNRSTAKAQDRAEELLAAFESCETEAGRKALTVWHSAETAPQPVIWQAVPELRPVFEAHLRSVAQLDGKVQADVIVAVVERIPFVLECGNCPQLRRALNWVMPSLDAYVEQINPETISALLAKIDDVTEALTRGFRFNGDMLGYVAGGMLEVMLNAPESASAVNASRSSLTALYRLLDENLISIDGGVGPWTTLRPALQKALGLKEEDSYHTWARQQIAEYLLSAKRKIFELGGAELAAKLYDKGPRTHPLSRSGSNKVCETWAECRTMTQTKRGELFLGLIDVEDHLAGEEKLNETDRLAHLKVKAVRSATQLHKDSGIGLTHFQNLLSNFKMQFSDAEFAKIIRAIPRQRGVYARRLVNHAFEACSKPGFDETYNALCDVFGSDGKLRRFHHVQHPGIEAKFQVLVEARGRRDHGEQKLAEFKDSKPDPQRLRLLETYKFPDESPIHGLTIEDIGLLADLILLGSELIGKSKPSGKWLAKAKAEVGASPHYKHLFTKLIGGEFDDVPNSQDFEAAMQGLIYLSVGLPADEACASLAQYARKICFKTIEGVGVNREKLGNACLWALINRADGAGVPHLARLLVRIKYPKVKKKIGAALDEAAKLSGVSRGELEEMALATHGLSADAACEVPIGTGHARIAITGPADVGITWRRDGGKWTPNVPSALAAEKAAISQVRKLAKEIEMDQAVLVHRIQQVWLEDRSWTADGWRQVFVDHPLRIKFAESLIWLLDRGGDRVSALWRNGRFEDSSGQAIDATAAVITLWHPIGRAVAETIAWRSRLRELSIKQPFKQVHREVYLVTPAELATSTYSNRFAGHVLKQHQMMTLARLNGWNVTHKIWADTPNDQPTHLVLPTFGLVAEYWTAGAGGDDPETTDSQAYLYLTTDQIRFYRIADPAAPVRSAAYGPGRSEIVPLPDVPPLVFSEVMRHCDLFVGVASVANDPQWRDGGQYAQRPNQWRRTAGREYWEGHAFGDLTQSALTRKDILSELLPSMALGGVARIDGKFLHVTGKRRTYKIHLGSGNILMEPNDAYLCIVQSPRTAAPDMRVALPFEGDVMLSLILSKAILLAADDKIDDPTILRQIG